MLVFLLATLVLSAVTTADSIVRRYDFRDEPNCSVKLAELNKIKESSRGFVGMCDPKCEDDGTYSPVQCCGAACFCSDPTGRQIHDYSVPVWESDGMTCACAVEDKEIADSGLFGRSVFCEKNGDYKPIQCTGSVCYCVDVKTGERREDTNHAIGTTYSCT